MDNIVWTGSGSPVLWPFQGNKHREDPWVRLSAPLIIKALCCTPWHMHYPTCKKTERYNREKQVADGDFSLNKLMKDFSSISELKTV